MSNRELDNLFKNKLDELEVRPSAGSWEKIQGNLTQEGKRGAWFYAGIAAAIVLLAIFTGVFLFNNTGKQPEQQIALSQPESTVKNPGTSVPDEIEPTAPEEQKEWQSTGQEKMNEDKAGKQPAPTQTKNKTQKTDANTLKNINTAPSKAPQDQLAVEKQVTKGVDTSDPIPVSEDLIAVKELKIDTGATNETAIASTDQKQNDGGQTLVFNIEDFNAKVNVASANETEKEKRSTLKKVLDFAKSVKEGDGGLAELREAKNELFALNFKKENDNSK